MTRSSLGVAGVALVVVGIVLVGTGVILGSGTPAGGGWPGGMMGGSVAGRGMMGGYDAPAPADSDAQPGDAGFVAGTAATPRVIRLVAGPGYSFSPSDITVERGETITFAVTTMGPLVHEFMVGPAPAVAADEEGTPEIADIGMMQTKLLTYTFDGTGPYAYACHATGHYEAGMAGTITIVG